MVRVVLCLVFFVFTLKCIAQETEARLFRPFTDGAGHTPFKIKSVVKGNCFRQSELMPREDAWQCQAAHEKYDPCFKKPGENKKLYCPQSPWNGDSTVIEAGVVVDNEHFQLVNMGDNLPWVILLDGGNICQRILKKEQFDQQPIEYRCQDSSFLFGRLQRCKAQWSMLRYDGSRTGTAKINQGWF